MRSQTQLGRALFTPWLDSPKNRDVPEDFKRQIYQQARVAEARRRRRVPTDVNPDTGEEFLPDADEPVMGDMEPEPAPEPASF